MMLLTVSHTTTYSYRRPVRSGTHRQLLRPRCSHDIRLVNTRFTSTPPATIAPATIAWSHDLFGNAEATASFREPAETLTIESGLIADQHAPDWPVSAIAPRAHRYPFTYSDGEGMDLGTLRNPGDADRGGRVGQWARRFVMGPTTDTRSLLRDMSSGTADWIAYQGRDDEGTPTPLQPLERTWGACRDFAVLVAVAVGRDISQVRPVSGSFAGDPGDCLGVAVPVSVAAAPGAGR